MNAKFVVRCSKARRLLTSIPTADLLGSSALLVAIVTIGASIMGGNMTPEARHYLVASEVIAIVLAPVLIVVLISKTWLEYQRRKYDQSVISTFDMAFNALADERKDAATVCISFLKGNKDQDESKHWAQIEAGQREKVEPVLDFFEDVGFFLKGDQFSDEVTHHSFHHWIRGWYSVLKPYIDYYHDVRNEKAAYIWIGPLYERVSVIETHYPDAHLLLTTVAEKTQFLFEEGGGEIGAMVG